LDDESPITSGFPASSIMIVRSDGNDPFTIAAQTSAFMESDAGQVDQHSQHRRTVRTA